MASKLPVTNKPTGLSIVRNGWKYTFSWKIGDANYGAGILLQWRINNDKWTKIDIPTTTTTRSVTLTAADFFPTTVKELHSVSFRIRGKKSPVTEDGVTTVYAWSAFASLTFDMREPNAPTITAELQDQSNVSRFSWSVQTNANDHNQFTRTEWQTRLVRASNVTDGSKVKWSSGYDGWATGTSTDSGYTDRTEDTALLAADSYTRWVRVRSVGPRGVSAWRYAKHVYATPFKPVVRSAKATVSGQSTNVMMEWVANSNAAHPIDEVEAQYLIDTPAAGWTAPAGGSWEEGDTSRDTAGTDAASFSIDSFIGLDKALWVRAVAKHDSNVNRSDAYMVKHGKLTPPSGLTVTINADTHRASVEATNNSDVPDSRLAIVYKDSKHDPFVVGLIAHGSSDAVTVQLPDFDSASNIAVGVYAFQGTETHYTTSTNVVRYTIRANAISSTVYGGGSVPVAPSSVTAERAGEDVLVTWNRSWAAATVAEVSWSKNQNAWESTKQPETYEISNLYASHWRLSDLEEGHVWYIRVRLGKVTNNDTTWGPYSDTVEIDLSKEPTAPALQLSSTVIPRKGKFTASWTYESGDGTAQRSAAIREVTVSGTTVTEGAIIARASTARKAVISPAALGWANGSTHYIAVRVVSASGKPSLLSDPVPITVAAPISISITQNSFETVSLDDGSGGTRSVTALTELPLTVTVTGAGAGGITSLVIERAEAFNLERPDESVFTGYEGEAVFVYQQTGEAQITVDRESLIGSLDDGAQYRLTAAVRDGYGQTAKTAIDFEVHWSHQAVMPEGTAVLDGMVAVITPVAPEDYTSGDTCDVYRLSADAPVLVLEDAAFGETYVDPYPAIGNTGGYRFVYKTADGDYITADDKLAWLDVPAGVDAAVTIIDFDGSQVLLEYDMAVSHSWEKDFTETTYLGGSVQGDWNKAVHRNTTVSSDVIVTGDPALIALMRRLAAYPGICHVRTVDGSSFAADVQVTESRSFEQAGKIAAFDVAIKQVAPQGLDGVLQSEWVTA